jgi:hypothetical protein
VQPHRLVVPHREADQHLASVAASIVA